MRADPSHPIRPFWERTSDFFKRPFRLTHLGWLALLSLVSLFVTAFMGIGITLFFVQLGIWLTGVRHAFTAMDLAARGYFDLGDDQAEWLRDAPERANLPWKMVAITFCCIAFVGVLRRFSPGLAQLVGLCLPLVLPAMTMRLSASNSFAEAIWPGSWWRMMTGIGWPYLVLCLFLMLLLNGMPIALSLVLPKAHPWLVIPVANFVGLYFLLVSFLLMGYAMYQYHEPLGLVADGLAHSMEPEDPKQMFEREIGALVTQGKLADAQTLVQERLRYDPYDWSAQDHLYKLLLLEGPSARWAKQAQDLLGRCLSAQRDARALEVYRDLSRHGHVVPLNAQHSLALAQAADKVGETELAVGLVKGFDKRFPNHTLLPDVYFLSARIASERLRRHTQARALLQTLLTRFPQHPLTAQAEVYLKVLDQLQSPRPA